VGELSKSHYRENSTLKMSIQTGGDEIVEESIFDTGLWLYLRACATAKPPRSKGCWQRSGPEPFPYL
jgi:hypothetical protein